MLSIKNICVVSYLYPADAKFEFRHEGRLSLPTSLAVQLAKVCDINSKEATTGTVTSFQTHHCYFFMFL